MIERSGLLALALLLLLPSHCASASAATAVLRLEARLTKATTVPPLAQHANNDLSILPAQICGIVGAYVLSVVLVGTYLLTFGRKMRRDAQIGSGIMPAPIEMVKSPRKVYDPSPLSPSSTAKSWMRGKFGKSQKSLNGSIKSGLSSQPVSPGLDPNHMSFDAKVIENAKEERQKEMERLYAAVMEHDAKMSKESVVHVQEREASGSSGSDEEEIAKQPPYKRDMHIRTDNLYPLASPAALPSPHSARSPVRAIYPPDSQMPSVPTSPTSPVRAGAAGNYPPPNPSPPRRIAPAQKSPGLPQSPRSILVQNRQSSASSVVSASSSKTRRALKNLRISAPAPKELEDDDERTPLTPRFYDPPPPPQLPGNQQQQPPTPHTGLSMHSNMTMSTAGTADSQDYNYEGLDKPQPLPSAAPQRGLQKTVALDLPPDRSAIHTATTTTKSAANSTGHLPLRNLAAYNNANTTSPSPLSPSYDNFKWGQHPPPPTPIKTTYLERNPANGPRGPLTAGLTPRTGVPMTPYSPYMPFTPITPVTPHLVSKREMKERRKMEGRRGRLGGEEGLVRAEGELWDSGY